MVVKTAVNLSGAFSVANDGFFIAGWGALPSALATAGASFSAVVSLSSALRQEASRERERKGVMNFISRVMKEHL